MDSSAIWEKAVYPFLLAVVLPFVIAYLRIQIAKVGDEKLRYRLDDLVLAAEQMVPKGDPEANAKKLALVENAAPKGTPRILIEAAVAKNKPYCAPPKTVTPEEPQ